MSTKLPKNKIVIIDNYDSFTYNLVHIIEEVVNHEVDVLKNDQFEIEDIDKYDYIFLSPGPGVPNEAGLLKDVILRYGSSKKILGVCLGLQAIGEVYGATLKNLNNVLHGQRTLMHQTKIESPIFNEIPKDFYAGRYHSWVIDRASNISALDITAVGQENEIMAAHHKTYNVHGVQFHPESIMTDEGRKMIENFLSL